MSAKSRLSPIIAGIVLCSLFCTACVSTNIGDVTYSGEVLSIPVSHTGEPSEGYIQVTVYRIQDMQQVENIVLYAPAALQPGENRLTVPGALAPGEYKLYLYLIQEGERKAAVVRDLVVT